MPPIAWQGRANDIERRSQIGYIGGINLGRGPSMYLCLCNRITDRDFRAQCEGEACSLAMVYRSLGAEPQCGKCVPYVRQMLRQAADRRDGAD